MARREDMERRETPPAAMRTARPELLSRCSIAALVAMALGGCSINLPMTSLVPEPETTASIVPAPSPVSMGLTEEEWSKASAALDKALDPLQNGAAVRWADKESGLNGHFVAAGPAYVRNDQVCRAFKAVVGLPPQDRQHLGTACRTGAGVWTLQKVRPFPGAA
jgi:surface antigen